MTVWFVHLIRPRILIQSSLEAILHELLSDSFNAGKDTNECSHERRITYSYIHFL